MSLPVKLGIKRAAIASLVGIVVTVLLFLSQHPESWVQYFHGRELLVVGMTALILGLLKFFKELGKLLLGEEVGPLYQAPTDPFPPEPTPTPPPRDVRGRFTKKPDP